MVDKRGIIIGIDAGTSVIKSVAFDLFGRQIAISAVPNSYQTGADGSVIQSLEQTWQKCVDTLRDLNIQIENLSSRLAAIAVTGQGDGTWLVGENNKPIGDAWLWLDARASSTVMKIQKGELERARFEATGTGLNTCQQGSQLAHIDAHTPEKLNEVEVAMHCKDWLFLNLTGIRATDPSEASFTFGNFRDRQYSDEVIEALGLSHRQNILPDIIDGWRHAFPLTSSTANEVGLLAGTPVVLGYVDMAMTALGAGVHTGDNGSACSTIGSTGVHMRSVASDDVYLNTEGTGYVICLPIPNRVTQVQTNMAATLNIDWVLDLARDITCTFGSNPSDSELVDQIDNWVTAAKPASLIYHPYISEAGERGPFVDSSARAGFLGLNSTHGFADLMRAVVEGLGMAARDCYSSMGSMPTELRLTGGAARSVILRQILAACLNTPVRISTREEAGAAGCGMMAAVAIGVYQNMEDCIAEWTTPLLGEVGKPNAALVWKYDVLFRNYYQSRKALEPIWSQMASPKTND